jgi:hypothetical protein
MGAKKPDCYKCIHRREVPGDAHSRCNNAKSHVKGNPTGIRRGWFMWPFNFDPTWLDSCDGFSTDAADKLPEHKADPLVELMAMLR